MKCKVPALAARIPHAAVLFIFVLMVAPVTQAASERADEPVSAEEAEFDELAAQKKAAESEGDWVQKKETQVEINQQLILAPWATPPFGTTVFRLTHEEILQRWPRLAQTYRMPPPSVADLRERFARFPIYAKTCKGCEQDVEGTYKRLMDVWAMYFQGNYRGAFDTGKPLGAVAIVPVGLSEIFYAMYLEEDLARKHMLLQDAANYGREIGAGLDGMKKIPAYKDEYILLRGGYSAAIGRIAEDLPIPVVLARNYVFKILDAAGDVKSTDADHPMALLFSGTLDANVVRKLGKATGRIAYGASLTDMKKDFDLAMTQAPDSALIRYEYANSLLYMAKKREIEQALHHLSYAANIRPTTALEALDSMYAAKRKKEVEALAAWSGSFRAYERKRLAYQKSTGKNLYCVLPEKCPPFIVR